MASKPQESPAYFFTQTPSVPSPESGHPPPQGMPDEAASHVGSVSGSEDEVLLLWAAAQWTGTELEGCGSSPARGERAARSENTRAGAIFLIRTAGSFPEDGRSSKSTCHGAPKKLPFLSLPEKYQRKRISINDGASGPARGTTRPPCAGWKPVGLTFPTPPATTTPDRASSPALQADKPPGPPPPSAARRRR
jgi:hypothetical protein